MPVPSAPRASMHSAPVGVAARAAGIIDSVTNPMAIRPKVTAVGRHDFQAFGDEEK